MTLVLLDRDGVINEDSPNYIRCKSEWHPIGGSLHAIARLSQSGRTVAVCSNQSAVGRGLLSSDDLRSIDCKMIDAIQREGGYLAGIYYCIHAPEQNCRCRKPAPGLLETAIREFSANAQDTVVIGDSVRDVQAAHAAGCTAVLVRTGNGAHHEEEARALGVEHVFDDLAAAVDWLLRR